MNYKLKHLSKYCCKPATEAEFEAVKMAAELGGVSIWQSRIIERLDNRHPYFYVATDGDLAKLCIKGELEEISVLDFIKKLRMTESEAKELEDDRVNFEKHSSLMGFIDAKNVKHIRAFDGHYFKVSEDGLTVTLHKKEVK